MIRGITYDKQLFKSNDFALMTNKFFSNNDGKVNGCNLSTSGNTIIMDTGWFIASGYYTNISTQEVIEATQSGTLVYEIDLSKTNTIQSFNQGSFKIITGTARQDDLFNNGTIYQLPIAEITIDGTNTTITKTLWDDIKGEAITEEEVDEKLTDYDTSTEVDEKLTNMKNAMVYSETEVKTDESWLGKPVYRKVIIKKPSQIRTGSGEKTWQINHGIVNLDEITNVYGLLSNVTITDTEWGPVTDQLRINRVYSDSHSNATYRGKIVGSMSLDYPDTYNLKIVLEYTKTTDEKEVNK